MKVLTVVSHPRTDSLTMQVAEQFIKGLKEAGHEVEVLDLYRENFDPVLLGEDEPDWADDGIHYSETVMREIDRMNQADGLAFIFPVWWYSIPAMLKGYIDRVWQYNYAYGNSKLPHERIQWIGMVGASEKQFDKRQYNKLISYYLNIGLSQFVGVDTSRVDLFYDTLTSMDPDVQKEFGEQWMKRAYELGKTYGTFETEQDGLTLGE